MARLRQTLIPICASAILLAAAGVSAAQAQAPTQEAPPATTGYVLPQTEVWELAAKDGYPYQIFVSVPTGTPPPEGYPVLYVLDGNAMFAGFAETRRILEYIKSDVGQMIVVGIGYKTDKAYDLRRIYDFTEDHQNPVMPAQAYLVDYKAGGRAEFASYILETLRPELARRYSVHPHRQALFGHSLGGLFGLYMFYSHATEFNAIISASPTIFWNNQSILAEERSFASRLAEGRIPGVLGKLRLVTGALDETVVENTDAMSLARRLEPLSACGLRSEFEQFEGEVHVTVPSRSVTSTLRFAATWP